MEIPGLSIIPVLFVVLIIVPGVFAKRFYFSGVFSKQFGTGDFADRLITSIFWGFIVQVVSYLVYSRYFNFTLLDIKEYLVSAYSDLSSNKLPHDIEKYNLWMVLGYVLTTVGISALIGWVGYSLVRAFRIDIRFNTFRYSNDWHYYFSGEILQTKRFKGRPKKIISTSADVLIDIGDPRPKLVSGILSEYTLSKNGELETVILTAARRYSDGEKDFKDIPGDFMIIPYAKVIDLNIRYEYPESGRHGFRQTLLKTFLSVYMAVTPASILIFPWFLGHPFYKTITGIIWLLIAWIFGSISLEFLFNKERSFEIRKTTLAITILLFLLGCLMGYRTLYL